jgi:hypothetical protein
MGFFPSPVYWVIAGLTLMVAIVMPGRLPPGERWGFVAIALLGAVATIGLAVMASLAK